MARDGAARQVGPGRLAHFEDEADDSEQKVAAPSLPPRVRRTADRAPASAGGGDQARPVSAPAPATQVRQDAPEPPPAVVETAVPSSKHAEAPAPPQAGVDRMRPSNVHVPVALLEVIARTCKEQGLSHGELIISAIEHTHSDLAGLIHPATTAGGSLFASRRSRAVRSKAGPLTPLNYRLRASDFAVIDQLVEDFSASSRGDLITTALTAYLTPSSS